ncbi:phasin family protein [Massilia arenosa]|uniref:Phasin family protein n=1 Tax=Zemynaea arenosa TaxID=2561931 RepID=A0A4Y9SHC0_9BURK|nr:phasin family protein [Massilia arenosa]TFW24057.1 phasin family protein [Massilia arenosa]
MTTLPEQITAAGRDQFLAQLEFFGSLAAAAIENTRQLADAQISAGRATFDRSAQAMRQLIEMPDAGRLPGAGFSTAGVDNWIEYSREIFTLMTGMAVPQRVAPPAPAPAQAPALAAPQEVYEAPSAAPQAPEQPQPAHQQSAQADDSGTAIAPAQLQKIVDAPAIGLPPAEGELTPVADAVARTVGKKPLAKK